jgi:hypothetical protein
MGHNCKAWVCRGEMVTSRSQIGLRYCFFPKKRRLLRENIKLDGIS